MIPEVHQHRVANNDRYCISRLFVNDEPTRFCDAIEDTVRDTNHNGRFDGEEQKIAARTAIPCGRYYVTFEPTTCGIGQRAKGGKIPLLHDVPSFASIRMHSGNDESHSAGCVILGYNTAKGKVTRSIEACLAFYERMRYEPFYLTITDDFAK